MVFTKHSGSDRSHFFFICLHLWHGDEDVVNESPLNLGSIRLSSSDAIVAWLCIDKHDRSVKLKCVATDSGNAPDGSSDATSVVNRLMRARFVCLLCRFWTRN